MAGCEVGGKVKTPHEPNKSLLQDQAALSQLRAVLYDDYAR